MNVRRGVARWDDQAVSRVAAAIGEPARARILYCLMDGRARTATELAVVAEVGAPTNSAHLNRLVAEHLVKLVSQGKHRFYSLEGPNVARVLESLSVLTGHPLSKFKPTTPDSLRAARTCYDHIAGTLGVTLNDRFIALGWISARANDGRSTYEVTEKGTKAFATHGINFNAELSKRRRFAFGCLDWSERRFHLGGALGAALFSLALKKKWVAPDLDSRALDVTSIGRRELHARFGVRV
jgi:DNA-binding transcriptional ArsR family regulator